MPRLYSVILVLAVLTVLILANIPAFRIPGDPDDKLLHFVAFYALALLAAGALPQKPAIKLWVWLAAFAGAIELIQLFMHQGREADWEDFGAGVAGAATALLIISIVRLAKSKRADV